MALIEVKKREKPLACYVFTSNKRLSEKILKDLSFGNGAVSEALTQITNSNLPYGGVGESDIGSFHGEYGFSTFSHYKRILEKPVWFEPGIKYFPRSKIKLKLIKTLMRG